MTVLKMIDIMLTDNENVYFDYVRFNGEWYQLLDDRQIKHVDYPEIRDDLMKKFDECDWLESDPDRWYRLIEIDVCDYGYNCLPDWDYEYRRYLFF
jgi:hypothetical protein